VYAHSGGACTLSALECIDECHRYATYWNCICFSVDYRKGPEVLAPRGQLDFMEALDYVATNAETYGVDVGKICIGGRDGGGWICMGACIQYIDMNKINPAKCQFLISPMVFEALPNTPDSDLEPWEMLFKS